IPVGDTPAGVAVTPDGSTVYVASHNRGFDIVSVINTATKTVFATIPVGSHPAGLAVTLDGSKVYVADSGASAVSVIDTSTNTVSNTIPVGLTPQAFGSFIGPAPALAFAGVPGSSNCNGNSVSALANQFGGMSAAAAAYGFSGVQALQN